MASKKPNGSTVDFLKAGAGSTADTQPAPKGGNADDAFGKRRDFTPGVDSALVQRQGPRAARPTGEAGEAAELALKE